MGIPPKSQPAIGTETRAWITERRKAPICEPSYRITAGAVLVPMRDGVILSGTLYRPEAVESLPGILIANGYGLAEPYVASTVDQLSRRGYMVLRANLRGVPPSEGTAGLYERYGEDAHDLIEWLARQIGCNGRIGMMGGSLLGLVQYLAAKEAPPSLKAILPDDAGSDNYWYLWHPGGMNAGPGRAARQAVNGAEQEYSLAVAHRDYDAFWRERTVLAEDLEAIARRGLAVFLTSGWDSYLLGSTKSYEWLRAGEPGKRLKMFVGPWAHGCFMAPDPPLTGPEPLPFTGFEYAVLWLDRWLKDVSNGVDDEPPVLLYVQGPNDWRFERDWPLSDERRVRLYLREQASGTGAGLNDGTLSGSSPGNDKAFAYEYSPDGPYNAASVSAVSRPCFDKTPYEAHGLAWTSEQLAVPTEVTGYPLLSFWSTLSATDTDFVVEITDVYADESGRLVSRQVTRGYLNATRHYSRDDPEPLIPGQPYRFAIELYPTSYVFPAGHRIRLTLQGSAIDPSATPPAEALPGFPGADPEVLATPHGPGLNLLACRVTVLQDRDHPSFIDLPIVGSGTVD